MTLKADKERISVYITKDLKQWLAHTAKKDNRSMSNYIGAALEQMMKGQLDPAAPENPATLNTSTFNGQTGK